MAGCLMSPVKTRTIIRMQDGLVRLLGNSVEGRAPLVTGMLQRNASEATSYWLQLVVSIGIATLGLVVGSGAVVIGAMLVAPLMVPIVGLAMGLATGSPFLVLRSAGRIAFSVIVAVGGSAAITVMLPFHELNAEISARTSPTVLDLITAAFCALAGVYASLRPGSDTAATAAGTSISISLVPPLCASGYGVGTGAWPIAGGAALLFLTNLVAIVVVGTVAFVAAGFNRVGVVALEHDELQKDVKGAPIARTLARRLARLFSSRGGSVLRLMMPFVLLALVYVPLRRALDEVAWEVRVRAAVRESLAREPLRIVQSKVRVERHAVEVVVVLLGTTREAEATRSRVDRDVRRASGVIPRIEVLAVPDANAFAGLESTLLTPRVPQVTSPPSLDEQIDTARAEIRSLIGALWPALASGEPLAVDFGAAGPGPLQVRVVHLGRALGNDAAEGLRRALEAKLAREVKLIDVAVPATELTREAGDFEFVAQVAAGVRATIGVSAVAVCVVRPEEPARRRGAAPAEIEFTRVVDEALMAHPRVTTRLGGPWSVSFVHGSCASPDATDAGVADAAEPESSRGD
jgi:uncharacterized hydrophobic protein (TIGR00271 family)